MRMKIKIIIIKNNKNKYKKNIIQNNKIMKMNNK